MYVPVCFDHNEQVCLVIRPKQVLEGALVAHQLLDHVLLNSLPELDYFGAADQQVFQVLIRKSHSDLVALSVCSTTGTATYCS